MRQLAFDPRVWKPIYERFFVAFEPDASAPAFFHKHCAAIKAKITTARDSEMRALIQEGRSASSVAPQLDESMTPLQKALLEKKRQLGHVTVNYFGKFKQQVRSLRHSSPVVVFDCNSRNLILGFQKGMEGHVWKEDVRIEPAITCSISSGAYHYRAMDFYFGSQLAAMDATEFPRKSLWSRGGALDRYSVQAIIKKFAKEYDALFIIGLFTTHAGFKNAGLLDRRQLLCKHYNCESEQTLFISAPEMDGFVLERGTVRLVAGEAISQDHLERMGSFSNCVFVGSGTLGKCEAMVRNILPQEVLVLNKESSAEEREGLSVRLGLQEVRPISRIS